jgi:penicillin-binding protein 1A
VAILGGGFVAYFAADLPDTSHLTGPQRTPAVTVLAADGTTLASYGDIWGEFLAVSELPVILSQAAIAMEDRRFYNHLGIDVIGLMRAALKNLFKGRIVQGGSTITQQVAKVVFLTPERTLKRKIQEVLLAFWLEHKFTKDQILTIYLNRIYLGAGAYGVDAAARRYFGKSAREVSLSEAAMLAGLIKAPSRYAPTRDMARARARASLVLEAMVKNGFLASEEAAMARRDPARLAPETVPGGGSRYFADWVLEQVPSFVGRDHRALTVVTTLDPALQQAAELAVARLLAGDGARRGVAQAGLAALGRGGAVRAMVGGKDYRVSQFNRATQALRQPGSAFKLVVYAAAFEAGLRPDDRLEDGPVEIDGWSPRNYDGRYRGLVTLREAFARSINTVAVKVGQRAGVRGMIKMARRLGITSKLPARASLALGAGEVSLLELTAAYAALANGGVRALPHGIVMIMDRNGDELYRRAGSGGGAVMSQAALDGMTDLLGAAVSWGTGRAAALDARFGAVFGKTGTSQDFRDAWFVGFSQGGIMDGVVTGVWLGNDDATPTDHVTGGELPARLWREFMILAGG